MAIEDVIAALPLQVLDNIGLLIKILQALGVAFILYFLYLILIGILNYRRLRKLKDIEEKMDIIEKKLNIIIKNSKKR